MKKLLTIIILISMLSIIVLGYQTFSNNLYRKLVRFPDDYENQTATFYGEVLQWYSSDGLDFYHIKTSNEYDAQNGHRILFVCQQDDRRFIFLKGDMVKIYDAFYITSYSYETVLGSISIIPAFGASEYTSSTVY